MISFYNFFEDLNSLSLLLGVDSVVLIWRILFCAVPLRREEEEEGSGCGGGVGWDEPLK